MLLAKLQDYSMFSTYQASRIKAPIKKVIHRFSNTANFRRTSIKESMVPHKTRPWEGLHSLRVITCYHFPREGPSRLALWARKTDTSSKLVVLETFKLSLTLFRSPTRQDIAKDLEV